MYEGEYLRPWFEHNVAPIGAELFDIHTHIGANDPDGYSFTADDLIGELEALDARGAVFPMHEPGGYTVANDRVLAATAASEGRLVPFCRTDPARGGVAEVRRAVEAGARGIKLHPRAEGFSLSSPGVEEIFAFAGQERLPVIIHAGRGIPTLSLDALAYAASYPDARIILAHAGISDLSWIWREAPQHPNLFFDLSWWQSADLLATLALIPPGQLVFASDLPYFDPLTVATTIARYGLQLGYSNEQLAVVLGAQARRIVDREDTIDLGPAIGCRQLPYMVLLDRVSSWLDFAMGRMTIGDSGFEALSLARLACDVGDGDAPEAAAARNVLALLDRLDRYAAELLTMDCKQPEPPGTQIVMLAACIARTPEVSLPAIPELTSSREMSAASMAGHRELADSPLSRSRSILGDLRRSSRADHFALDPGPARPGISGIHAVPEPPPD